MIRELALKNRSYRRFYQNKKIEMKTLRDLVDIGRITPSGANKQPLRYKLVCDENGNQKVFECLRWAGYFEDWDGPKDGERPAAYIIIVSKKGINAPNDEGIAGQTMLLAAVEFGLGGCFIGNIDRECLSNIIGLSEDYTVKLVIALGYPKEEVVLEDIKTGDDVKYYRDKNQVHHVPKLCLEDIIL